MLGGKSSRVYHREAIPMLFPVLNLTATGSCSIANKFANYSAQGSWHCVLRIR